MQTLPPYLKACVEKGILDKRTAMRIELYRHTRGLGRFESPYTLLTPRPDPELTFESFVTFKGNSFAAELAQKVASQSPESLPYNPLYFYGDVGLGKTHLLAAIANSTCDSLSFAINTADLETEMKNANSEEARCDLRRWLSSAEILLLDDIQLCEGREELQREIFAVLNHLIRGHRWAVISSDVPPTRLEGIERRLLSRLQGGVIVSLQMADREERIVAINSFLGGYPVSQGVVDFLGDRLNESMRGLKAAVRQMIAMAEYSGRPITLDMAQSFVSGASGIKTEEPERMAVSTSQHGAGPSSGAPIVESDSAEDNSPINDYISESVDQISLLNHVGAVAAMHCENILLASGNKLHGSLVRFLVREAASFVQSIQAEFLGSFSLLTITFSNGFNVLTLKHFDAVYLVVLTKGGKPALCLPLIQEILEGYPLGSQLKDRSEERGDSTS
ncbi:DnaA ATPase domain-containing protein [Thermodesulfobacteriota bacterium]